MATNRRSNNRIGTRSRRTSGQNNNPEGRNQYSGVVGTARANPLAAAAAVGSAVAAGVFLWSRRGQISDQIQNLSDQISEWRDSSEDQFTGENVTADTSANSGSRYRKRSRSQAEIAEEALTLKEIGDPSAS